MLKMFDAIFRRHGDTDPAFNIKTIYGGHYRATYRGIEAFRCPFDYVIYQMLICEVKPDLIIEVGTYAGGGALYLADLLNNIGHGMVHTIDIEKKSAEIVSRHPRIALFTDGWKAYDLAAARIFPKILVIEDSTHMYENTLGVLRKFSPLVTPGSYFIVEDGVVSALGLGKKHNGGPLRAIREFLASDNSFEIDRRWCDFFGKNATFNPNGYLRKIST